MQIRKALLFLCGVLGAINYGTCCQLSEFMCDTGYCVALDKFCNGNDDCGDKSDEPPYCSRKFISHDHVPCLNKSITQLCTFFLFIIFFFKYGTFSDRFICFHKMYKTITEIIRGITRDQQVREPFDVDKRNFKA